MSYIETSARYQRKDDNGKVKKVSERYLVDALSVTEATAKTIEHIVAVDGELDVTSAKMTNIVEIFGDKDADKFYLAKVVFYTIDERSGADMRKPSQWLIGATDFNDAYEQVLRAFNAITTADPELTSLSESAIVEFIQANK